MEGKKEEGKKGGGEGGKKKERKKLIYNKKLFLIPAVSHNLYLESYTVSPP